MNENVQKAAALSTLALGASQALTPRLAGRVFGLGDIEDGTTLWLARLLGCANLAIGAANLDPSRRPVMRAHSLGLLAGNAAVTAVAGAQGQITKRTAASVLAFIAALVPATLAAE